MQKKYWTVLGIATTIVSMQIASGQIELPQSGEEQGEEVFVAPNTKPLRSENSVKKNGKLADNHMASGAKHEETSGNDDKHEPNAPAKDSQDIHAQSEPSNDSHESKAHDEAVTEPGGMDQNANSDVSDANDEHGSTESESPISHGQNGYIWFGAVFVVLLVLIFALT